MRKFGHYAGIIFIMFWGLAPFYWMLVTPFKDGMNLVAKEYVACHDDGSGALVLSEFAGAADELSQAYLCNPFDIESVKAALLNALKALDDAPSTMTQRMLTMHQQVAEHDVQLWSQSFLGCLRQAEEQRAGA